MYEYESDTDNYWREYQPRAPRIRRMMSPGIDDIVSNIPDAYQSMVAGKVDRHRGKGRKKSRMARKRHYLLTRTDGCKPTSGHSQNLDDDDDEIMSD